DGQSRELRDPVAVQADGPGGRVQPLAAAGLARPLGREGAEVAAVARLEALAEDGERPVVAVEDRAALAGAELGDGTVEGHARGSERAEEPALLGAQLGPLEGEEGAGLEGAALVEHRRRVDLLAHAGAVAGGTGALAAVEREEPRVERRKAGVAGGAEQPLGVQALCPARERDHGPAAQTERSVERLLERRRGRR